MTQTVTLRKKKRANPEEVIQKAVAQYLAVAMPSDCMWFAVPNGGMSKGENGRRKSMGVRAGVPDLCFVCGGKVAFIEMKAPKGVLSDEQKAFRDWCVVNDVDWALCRSVEQVEAALRMWGIPLKARVA